MAAKSIMVMGTMSSAGKSFLAAGLCRIFREEGYRVAPFKSQNMALNSYITKDGLEMGRAQVVQAEAAGIEPDVRMNPILLKPTSEKGSQVIVNGAVYGTMRAQEYYQRKRELVPLIQKAYNSLAAEQDIIVLEGAGSPAEINLRQVDVVNMGMAELSDSPVILVGDIDRGGVFAALYGTVALLEEEERRRIRGFVINKFRGDSEILKPGLSMLEERTGIPVLGVLPYAEIHLEEEDSLSEELLRHTAEQQALLDLAVIRFPRISNFTDFEALGRIPGVSLRYVTQRRQLGRPDLILLPGTKSTMADLRWMRQSGIEAEVLKCHAAGVPVLGICGGYQMLGRTLADPEQTEDGGTLRGMALLDTETVFQVQKHRSQTAGTFAPLPGLLSGLSGLSAKGYEIHMGTTSGGADAVPFFQRDSGETVGYCSLDGTVCGTYLHGLFDNPAVTQALLQALLAKKVSPLRKPQCWIRRFIRNSSSGGSPRCSGKIWICRGFSAFWKNGGIRREAASGGIHHRSVRSCGKPGIGFVADPGYLPGICSAGNPGRKNTGSLRCSRFVPMSAACEKTAETIRMRQTAVW